MDTIAIELKADQVVLLKENGLIQEGVKNKIDNMFCLYSHGRWILKGSLQKFVTGNNYENPSWMIIDRFLYKMKKLHGIDLRSNSVFRMDIGVVVPCSNIPSTLGNIIEINGRYKKSVYSKRYSLLFHNRSTGIAIYDKTKELNDEIYHSNGDRLLRVELRALKSASCRRLGIVTLNDLRNETKQLALKRKLISMLKELKWYKSFEIEELTTNKNLLAFLFKYYFDKFGYDEFFHVLEDHRLSNVVTTSQKSEFKKSVLKMISESKYNKLMWRDDLLSSVNAVIN